MEGIIVLVAFSAAFAGIAVWAYLPRNKARLNAYAEIPLREEHHGR